MSILAPFNATDQKFLNEVDSACRAVMAGMEEEVNAASLSGKKELQLDVETIAWLKFIRGYGILFNRAVDAGWVEGIITENLPEDFGKPKEHI